jgi:hypothetical protein
VAREPFGAARLKPEAIMRTKRSRGLGRGPAAAGIGVLLVLTAGCAGSGTSANSGSGAGTASPSPPTPTQPGPTASPTATGTTGSLATLFPGNSSGGNGSTVSMPATHVGDENPGRITVSGPPPGSGTGSGITVSAATITGDSDFRLTDDQCRGHTLGPGETCTLSVEFIPGTVGTRSAQLTVPFSQAGGASAQSYLVHLSGEATSSSGSSTGTAGPTGTPSAGPIETGVANASTS